MARRRTRTPLSWNGRPLASTTPPIAARGVSMGYERHITVSRWLLDLQAGTMSSCASFGERRCDATERASAASLALRRRFIQCQDPVSHRVPALVLRARLPVRVRRAPESAADHPTGGRRAASYGSPSMVTGRLRAQESPSAGGNRRVAIAGAFARAAPRAALGAKRRRVSHRFTQRPRKGSVGSYPNLSAIESHPLETSRTSADPIISSSTTLPSRGCARGDASRQAPESPRPGRRGARP